jgi:hypothetical protein
MRTFSLRHEAILAALGLVMLLILARQSEQFFTLGNLLNQARLMT